MDDFTIISYPGARDNTLLSLVEDRSKYMLPFGGRYRVVDFTIRNSTASGAKRTIIYNNFEDDLEDYVENYGPFKDKNFPSIKVISRGFSDIRFCYNIIMNSNTHYYIIYNGDNPSMIDFADLIYRYKKRKARSVLFTLKYFNRESMAYTILVTDQKSLLGVVNSAIDENRQSPNLFEMIINIMINRGIKKDTTEAYYWPIKNIPDYYQFNMDIMQNKELFSRIYHDRFIKTYIKGSGSASIGKHGKIINSFVSDNCIIHGTVRNSIIFPDVEISEKTVVSNSILLPHNRVGIGTRITKSVIDELLLPKIQAGVENSTAIPVNIGSQCYIGSDNEQMKNNDFPRSIYRSITLIGKNCEIPDGSRIGGACYVTSGKGREFFSKSKYLYDGLSLVK